MNNFENRKRVLVIDDLPINLKLAQKYLESDYDVFLSENASEITQTVKTTNPDIILLDLFLGRDNGLEILEEIQSDYTLSQIPVVMYSSSEDGTIIEKALEIGAKDYIIKPAQKEELLSRINNIVRTAN